MRVLFAFLLLALPLMMGPARAATFAEKNLAQLVTESEQIFVGTVSSLASRKLANGAIVTDIVFASPQVVKGSDTGANVTLLALGGEVDGVRLEIPGLPVFRRDVRYLVFSAGNGRDMFPVVGGPAGMFQLGADVAGGATVLAHSGEALGTAIASEVLQGLALSAQNPASAPITLAMFLAAIKAQLGQR